MEMAEQKLPRHKHILIHEMKQLPLMLYFVAGTLKVCIRKHPLKMSKNLCFRLVCDCLAISWGPTVILSCVELESFCRKSLLRHLRQNSVCEIRFSASHKRCPCSDWRVLQQSVTTEATIWDGRRDLRWIMQDLHLFSGRILSLILRVVCL